MTSSYSDHLLRDIERMKNEMTATLPKEMAGAANLMAHPAAGAMALSALGFGLASQAAGTWLGAMSAAAEVSQRFWQPLIDEMQEQSGTDRAASALRLVPSQPAGPSSEAKPAPAASVAATVPVLKIVAADAPPQMRDDLKVISGIGPKLEQVLNGQGVWRYAQIAAWTPAEIARIEELLGFAGRVGRDGWIAQAAKLAKAVT